MAGVYAIDSLATEGALFRVLRGRFRTADDPARAHELVYLDTFDWRIYASGTTLAAGTEDERPVIWWRTLDGRLLQRLIGVPAPSFASELPASALRTALLERVESRRLSSVVRVELRTRGVRVLDDHGKTVARATFERGFAKGPDASRRRRLGATLTILPLRGYEKAGMRIVELLERERRLEPATGSALTRALAAIGQRPNDVDTSFHPVLDRSLSAAAAVRAVLGRLCELMRLNEPGLCDNLDPEFLHDFRVAVRRTRSLLGQIKHVLPAEPRQHFRDEFRWLGTLTGPTRDLDVYLVKLPTYRALLPDELRGELDGLERLLEQHQRAEHGKLVTGLRSGRYARLVKDWPRFLARTWEANGGPDAARPVVEVASPRISRAFERAVEHGEGLDDHAPADLLHRLRIECKKLRYLLEFFQSLYDEGEVRVLVKHLKKLQDNLGDFNDYEVQQRAIESFAHELGSAGGASAGLALGRLVECLHACQRAERERFTESFAHFATPANRRRVAALFGAGVTA